MSAIDPRRPRPDHPWLDAFEKAPAERFDDLIRGIALPFPYGRGRPSDVLDTLFGNLGANDPLLRLLDHTVDAWLAARPADPPAFRLRYGPARYAGEVADALSLVPRLDLRDSAARLHAAVNALEPWAAGLVVDSAHDPRAELWRTLAQTQTDDTYQADWFGFCDRAGRGEPDYFLDIGLLGLLGLPKPPAPVSEAVLAGFARWACHLGPQDRDDFLLQWYSLKALYPSSPPAWRHRLEPLFKEHARRPFVAWWKEDVKGGTAAGGAKPPRVIKTPPRERREKIELRLAKEPVAAVRSDIEALIADQLCYAEATGESHFVVRTACNIGDLVLDQAPDLAHDLARIGVRWEPGHMYGWTLWARSLAALGQEDLAEIVFWETLRRFPDDVVSLSALAELLARTGRAGEAEALYRETARRFPGDAVCRGGLATLLIRQGRLDGVPAILAEIARVDRASAGSLSAALARARRGEEPFPGHDAPPAPPPAVAEDAEARALGDDGRVQRADFRLGPALDGLPDEVQALLRQAARDDLDAVLAARPNHAGAILVAMERLDDPAERWAGLEPAFPNNYGLRLAFARASRDAAAREAILARFPGRAPVTRLAVGLGDGGAAAVAGWLAGPAPQDDPVTAFVHRRLHTRLGGEPTADAVRALVDGGDADLAATLTAATRMAVNEQAPVLRS
ncbi:tetratricopeptide repeat protein [Azospirillum halopraeferens]|uniref:tetratricopeptide repeat protein n=1 Tax=Azospirillum halopraeferens TaxID=34010 RepID=UPI00041C7526|nr:tetratricopeptide repeat protein [Azospirillum halopraeferens]